MTELRNLSADIAAVYDGYPDQARRKALQLRQLIIDSARENGLEKPDETLKWGEPSYVVKKGSAVRIGWSEKRSDDIGLYFNCQTSLVETLSLIHI